MPRRKCGHHRILAYFPHSLLKSGTRWYSRKVASCKTGHQATRQDNSWQSSRVSSKIDWFPKISGHQARPTYPLLYYFCGATLRNECSATNDTQLTHWNRTVQIKSGKQTTLHWDTLPTICNAPFRCAWRRTLVITLRDVSLLMCPININHIFFHTFFIYS